MDPKLGPPGPVVSFADKMRATGKSSAMIGIVVITIGGIYSGFFTAGEAAGVGAFLFTGGNIATFAEWALASFEDGVRG